MTKDPLNCNMFPAEGEAEAALRKHPDFQDFVLKCDALADGGAQLKAWWQYKNTEKKSKQQHGGWQLFKLRLMERLGTLGHDSVSIGTSRGSVDGIRAVWATLLCPSSLVYHI